MSERVDTAWGVRFVTVSGEEFAECLKCGADAGWVDCENCVDGFTGHDCGEDTCCCAYPEENVVCDICDGREGWYICERNCDNRGDARPDIPAPTHPETERSDRDAR